MIGISPHSNPHKLDVLIGLTMPHYCRRGHYREAFSNFRSSSSSSREALPCYRSRLDHLSRRALPYYLNRHREVFLEDHSSRLDYCSRKTLPHFHSRVHYKRFKVYPSREGSQQMLQDPADVVKQASLFGVKDAGKFARLLASQAFFSDDVLSVNGSW